jgi:hypothetical protein
MSTETATKSMTHAQAEALARILYGNDVPIVRRTRIVDKASTFEAHRIISYVLTHMMSDKDNASYVAEQLGLEDPNEDLIC